MFDEVAKVLKCKHVTVRYCLTALFMPKSTPNRKELMDNYILAE